MMSELEEPFLCIEVDSKSTMQSLAQRFDSLFPNKIIRLIIDGEYSNVFYMGNSSWKMIKSNKKYIMEFKIFTEDPVNDFFEDNQKELLCILGIDINNFKIMGDVQLFNHYYDGVIASDGNYIIIDQFLFSDANKFLKEFKNLFDHDIKIDLLNDEETGMIIIHSKNNIWEKND